ncbi:MAG: hypothetical protein NG747_09905 [Candidatus Brocadia sp.]|nr:hypothetical protein [Candidatus Brocadia sp.]
MNNNVITSIARISFDKGFSSLRFNYRGVGKSECHVKDIARRFQYWDISLNGGDYTDAVTDTHAALNFLISQIGKEQGIFIAGYSFGAVVGMRAGVESKDVKAFASISTPFYRYNFDFLQACKKGKLFIYSQNDFAATVEDTIKSFEDLSSPKILELIEESDHFYRGQEDHVSQKVCVFFSNVKLKKLE